MKVYYKAFLFLQQPLLRAVQRVCTENYQLSFLLMVNKKNSSRFGKNIFSMQLYKLNEPDFNVIKTNKTNLWTELDDEM